MPRSSFRTVHPFGLLWTQRNGGHWIATRGREISRTYADHENYSSNITIVPREFGERYPLRPTTLDPPTHRPFRKLLNAALIKAARGALSGCVVAFNRFQRGNGGKLRDNLDLLDNAVKEIARWQTPITHLRRTATEDQEFRGHLIREGDKVVMRYCSENRDESRFANGDIFRVDRPNARHHLSYGYGIHRCLGQHVARMELRILLEEIIRRFEWIELVDAPKRVASNFFR